jgi:PD-(D/E)XK nuclease superfamily
MRISVSERATFRRCRRQWDLVSQNRKALVPIGLPQTHFYVGQAFHIALAAQVMKKDPLTELWSWWKENVGAVKPDDENYNLVRGLVIHYFNYYGWKNPVKPMRYVAAELAFRVPIPATRGFLIGTFDGIVLDKERRKVWIVDHKTYTQQPRLDTMEYSDQMVAYCWAFLQLFHEPPAGVLYDGIRKKLPMQPALLGDGTLSRNITRQMTSASYRSALAQHHLCEADYAHEINLLKAQESLEQTEFFTRWKINYPHAMLQSFEEQLVDEYRDMDSEALRLYPNFRWDGCWDCNVRDICQAMQRKEDADFLIEHRYRKGEGYATIKAQELTPNTVRRLSDLKGLLDGTRDSGEVKTSFGAEGPYGAEHGYLRPGGVGQNDVGLYSPKTPVG